MARLRALSLAASVILVLLCKSGSEAVRLTPTTRTTATPGNATASGGNAATNKTASTSTPKAGKTFYYTLWLLDAGWGNRDTPSGGDTIVFQNFGLVPAKYFVQFDDQRTFSKCNYRAVQYLKAFDWFGEEYKYTVPYYTKGDHLYFGSSAWLCKNLGIKVKIPVKSYTP
ncbi:unnamed protein product [Closterium sp. NIES-65]|nr:unnamed protein product [Closterium sp. NIES-65]